MLLKKTKMKNTIYTIFTLLFLSSYLIPGASAGDKVGRITGKVFDASNGTALPEAVIKIESLNKGTVSDLDGKYEFSSIAVGTYTLKITYVGYKPQILNVEVRADISTQADAVLQPESSTTDTVTIEAERRNNNESSLLLKQQKSERISDGISEQQMKRAPDASASDVLKRIIGVSIISDKFIFVRGISERYSSTTLNGVQLPSTEPDKKAFTFDLFPSALLENLIISKSFSPDLPGNFSGGLVEITTKDIPDAFTYSLSTSSSYLTGTSTSGSFLTYPGNQIKMLGVNLGIDDGGRRLPANFPDIALISSNFSSDQLISFAKEFRNTWGVNKIKTPMNGGFQISAGNKFQVFKNPLGIFAAYTYRNGFSTKSELINGFDQDNNLTASYSGYLSTYKVDWGALLNLTYKAGDNNKFSVKNSYIQNAEDATQYLSGYNPDLQKKTYSTDFKERTLKSVQISGEHYIPFFAKVKLNWLASYSDAKRDEPDYKTLSYQRDPTGENPFEASITTGSLTFDGGSRLFTKLFDINRLIKGDVELPLTLFNTKLQLKGGVFANGTRRSFSARLFAPSFYNYTNIFVQQSILRQSIDSIFNLVNLRDSVMYYSEYTRSSDRYTAKDNLYAGYLMFDGTVGKMRVTAGARLESYIQQLNSFEGAEINVNLKNNDILPAVNLTYHLNSQTNLRASYYQTVSRPEFRELAPFGFTDFTTRQFVTGNPTGLSRTLVRNYDLRFEMFPKAGELISLSLFYKKIDSPIEEVFKLTSGNSLKTFENAKSGANNYGMEIELRKNLGFFSKDLSNFSLNANLSLVNSKINLQGTGSLGGNRERKLQGQAPYTINLRLFYDNSQTGTSINLLYNKIGDRISNVGTGDLSDEKEAGRDVVDLSFSQNFLKRFEAKFSVKDLLNQDIKFYQTQNDKDLTTRVYSSGTNYSLTLSYKY